MSVTVKDVESWALEEMKFVGKFPNSEMMQSLLSGPMQGIWRHIISNCRSQETVGNVRGNLALAKKKQFHIDSSLSISTINSSIRPGDGGEREELLSEQARLVGKLHDTLAKLERVRLGLREGEREREETERERLRVTEEVRRRRQGAALLALYAQQVKSTMGKLQSVTEKLKSWEKGMEEKRKLARDEQIFSSGNTLETATERSIRTCTTKAVELLVETVDSPEIPDRRSSVRGEILSSLAPLPGSAVQEALVKIIRCQTTKVKQMEKSLNLREEVKELRHTSHSNNNSSMATQLITSVKKEISQFYSRHLESHAELKAAKSRLHRHEEELRELVGSASGRDANHEKTILGNHVAGLLEKAKAAAVDSFYREEIERLKIHLNKQAERESEKKNLVDKVTAASNNIQNLTHFISTLIASNERSFQKLSCKQALNLHQKEEFRNLGNLVVEGIAKSKDSPSQQLKTFMQLPVERFCSTLVPCGKEQLLTTTSELGLYRLRSSLPLPLKVRETEQENISWSIVQLIRDVDRLRQEYSHRENCEKQERRGNCGATILELRELVERSRHRQITDFKPMLGAASAIKDKGMAVLRSVEVARQDWASQATAAAVCADPQLRVEGDRLPDWQERVRVAIARINKQ